jgi:hypothetical protein
MLAHSSQERSGLCEKPAETKQIAKKFLQAGSRADFLGTLRCGMEKSVRQPRPYVRKNIAESGTCISEILS